MKTHLAINGACGRMGQRLVALARREPSLRSWLGEGARWTEN